MIGSPLVATAREIALVTSGIIRYLPPVFVVVVVHGRH
jgi:hypothetical protein